MHTNTSLPNSHSLTLTSTLSPPPAAAMRRPFAARSPAAFTLSLLFLFLSTTSVSAWRPWPNSTTPTTPITTTAGPNASALAFGGSKKYEGSSEFVHLRYHMGPVLAGDHLAIHLIWYGRWAPSQKRIIRAFISAISDDSAPAPSVGGWWRAVTQYADQSGANVSRAVRLAAEKNDRRYSHGKSLTRLAVQSVIKAAVGAATKPLPISESGLYLVLTSDDVYVEDFCNQVCGFHYFTFPSIVGHTLPYAWVGDSATRCPGTCAYPFAVPDFIPSFTALTPPNGDAAVDGMVSVIAHEMAEAATNPLANAWYAGDDPAWPVEIADLCEGIYGSGGGGSYAGQMIKGSDGATYNMRGGRRRFLVQWVWSRTLNYCTGPNARDH